MYVTVVKPRSPGAMTPEHFRPNTPSPPANFKAMGTGRAAPGPAFERGAESILDLNWGGSSDLIWEDAIPPRSEMIWRRVDGYFHRKTSRSTNSPPDRVMRNEGTGRDHRCWSRNPNLVLGDACWYGLILMRTGERSTSSTMAAPLFLFFGL